MPIGQLLPCRLKALVVHEVILQGEILQCKNIFATHPLPRGYLKDCHCEPLSTPLQRSSVSVNAGFHHRHLNEGQKRLGLFSFCPNAHLPLPIPGSSRSTGDILIVMSVCAWYHGNDLPF